MNIDNFLIDSDADYKLCRAMFKVLNCNLLWIMKLSNNSLNMLITDKFILEHYWDKKYYLEDPTLHHHHTTQQTNNKSPWKITLGTECEFFHKTGFLYDLYKKFEIEEFASVEKSIGSEQYCFRFFTRNNRFVFRNRLLNNMPIIKCFINFMTEKFETQLHNQPAINMTGLTNTGNRETTL